MPFKNVWPKSYMRYVNTARKKCQDKYLKNIYFLFLYLSQPIQLCWHKLPNKYNLIVNTQNVYTKKEDVMKKFKIFSSLISLCFAMAVLVFGVFAVNQVDFRIGGSLNYVVRASIDIQTSVYYSDVYLQESEIYEKIEDIVSESNHGLSLLPLGSSLDYNSLTDKNNYSKNFDFEFNDSENAKLVYFIKMRVTNIGDKSIWVGANSDVELPYNVYSVNSGVETDIEAYDTRILVIAIAPEDVTQNIVGSGDNYLLSIYGETIDADNPCPYEYVYNDEEHKAYLDISNYTKDTLYIPAYVNGNDEIRLSRVFDSCTCTTAVVPSKILGLEVGAFKYCTSLSTVILNKSIQYINHEAFNDDQLISSNNGYYVQDKNGDNIALIKVSPLVGTFDISEDTIVIAEYAFDGCEGLISLEIPDNVLMLSGRLYDSSSDLEDLSIGSGVKKIPEYFFQNCENLTNLTLSEGLESFGKSAFSGTGISSVTIPSTVTSIGADAFYGCDNLTTITMLSSEPCGLVISRWKPNAWQTNMRYRNFPEGNDGFVIIVPIGSVSVYLETTVDGWSTYYDYIQEANS